MTRRKAVRRTPRSSADLDLLRTELIRDEGLRLHPYRDTVGKLTIGVGRNLDMGISEAEAMVMLNHDIAETLWSLQRALPWFAALDPVRQRVLCNLAFNVGVTGLMKFKKTLALIEDGLYADAADEMLRSRWAEQVKGRATRLAHMMRTGEVQV